MFAYKMRIAILRILQTYKPLAFVPKRVVERSAYRGPDRSCFCACTLVLGTVTDRVTRTNRGIRERVE